METVNNNALRASTLGVLAVDSSYDIALSTYDWLSRKEGQMGGTVEHFMHLSEDFTAQVKRVRLPNAPPPDRTLTADALSKETGMSGSPTLNSACAMLEILGVGRHSKVFDAGAGNGRLLFLACWAYDAVLGIGNELNGRVRSARRFIDAINNMQNPANLPNANIVLGSNVVLQPNWTSATEVISFLAAWSEEDKSKLFDSFMKSQAQVMVVGDFGSASLWQELAEDTAEEDQLPKCKCSMGGSINQQGSGAGYQMRVLVKTSGIFCPPAPVLPLWNTLGPNPPHISHMLLAGVRRATFPVRLLLPSADPALPSTRAALLARDWQTRMPCAELRVTVTAWTSWTFNKIAEEALRVANHRDAEPCLLSVLSPYYVATTEEAAGVNPDSLSLTTYLIPKDLWSKVSGEVIMQNNFQLIMTLPYSQAAFSTPSPLHDPLVNDWVIDCHGARWAAMASG